MLNWHLKKPAAAKAAQTALKRQENPTEPYGETFFLDKQAADALHKSELARQKKEKQNHR